MGDFIFTRGNWICFKIKQKEMQKKIQKWMELLSHYNKWQYVSRIKMVKLLNRDYWKINNQPLGTIKKTKNFIQNNKPKFFNFMWKQRPYFTIEFIENQTNIYFMYSPSLTILSRCIFIEEINISQSVWLYRNEALWFNGITHDICVLNVSWVW